MVAKAIILSSVLHDAVRELAEQPGASTLQLTMSERVRDHLRGAGAGLWTVQVGGAVVVVCAPLANHPFLSPPSRHAPSTHVDTLPRLQEPFFQMHTYNNAGGCTIQLRATSDAFITFEAPESRT